MRLRALRNARGWTVERVAQELLCSATKISRMETGSRRVSLRDVRDLCRLFQVTGEAETELMELAHQAREASWWTQYDDPLMSPLLGLEQEAAVITSFSMYYVPALLQTVDYAQAITRGIDREADAAVVAQRVEARMRRQRLLVQERPPHFRALLDEAVLHRQVGGPTVMNAQLRTILSAVGDERAVVQVIPFSVGAHAAIEQFDFLQFRVGSSHGPVVFIEGLFTNRYLERPAEVERYRQAIEHLRDAALSPRDSEGLIRQIQATYPD
jgi:transcriptional regulator with XRE-family HTH domain